MTLRITDLAVTPDFARLVTVGIYHTPIMVPVVDLNQSRGSQAGESTTQPTSGDVVPTNGTRNPDNRMIIYDLVTKQTESYVAVGWTRLFFLLLIRKAIDFDFNCSLSMQIYPLGRRTYKRKGLAEFSICPHQPLSRCKTLLSRYAVSFSLVFFCVP